MSEKPGSNSNNPRQKGIYDSSDKTGSPSQKSVKRVGMYDRPKQAVISPLILSIVVLLIALIIIGIIFFVIR